MKHYSNYTERLVNDAQKLSEIVLERKYSNVKLPKKFWSDERYKRDFMTQLRFANQLLKLYSFQAIKNALDISSKTYSLFAKWLDPICQQEEEKLTTKKIVKDFKQEFEAEYLNHPVEKQLPVPFSPHTVEYSKKQKTNSLADKLGDL